MVRRFGAKNGRRLVGCLSLAGSAVLLVAMSQAKGKIAIAILATLGFGVADLMLPTAWAICLDIGGAFAGSVSGFMNTAGQFGGFLCSIAYGYVVQATGSYNLPLAMVASMVLISAFLFAKIDASKPILEAEKSPS
jgi:ACS family glucarate transporter-like MFS transporter